MRELRQLRKENKLSAMPPRTERPEPPPAVFQTNPNLDVSRTDAGIPSDFRPSDKDVRADEVVEMMMKAGAQRGDREK